MLQHTRKGRRTFLSPLMIYDLSLDDGVLIEFSERRRTTTITHVLRVPNDRCIACYDDLTTTACVSSLSWGFLLCCGWVNKSRLGVIRQRCACSPLVFSITSDQPFHSLPRKEPVKLSSNDGEILVIQPLVRSSLRETPRWSNR